MTILKLSSTGQGEPFVGNEPRANRLLTQITERLGYARKEIDVRIVSH